MQALGHLRRALIKQPLQSQWVRAVSTTRYVKVNNTNNGVSKDKKAEEKEINVTTPSVTAQVEHFPTTTQFDAPVDLKDGEQQNWSSSFYGLSTERFPKDVSNILLEPINAEDIEIKPDGMIYLPEIKYRRILNRAFGPGGWGLAPRGEHTISPKNISREYALICSGRFVSQARGEQDFFDISGLPTASEGCKSNALMRCCKDLGVASELWDPTFIRKFKKKYCVEVWAEHVTTKKKKKLWKKKDDTLEYPYKEV
ncbi:MAG: mitochondrial genome maintenance protein [Benjaminiella poitrasii]|nr:MAG: mitochondrial genome maintenance protein [Benjaminiella poitrasii]